MLDITPGISNKSPNERLLYYATRGDYFRVIKAIKDGANVSSMYEGTENTALIIAADNNYISIVKVLVEYARANVEERNALGQTALMRAALKGHIRVVKYLIEKAWAKVDARDKLGNTPLVHSLFIQGNSLETMKYLIEKAHADVEVRNKQGLTPLLIAIFSADIRKVKYLVEKAHANIELAHDRFEGLNVAAISGITAVMGSINKKTKQQAITKYLEQKLEQIYKIPEGSLTSGAFGSSTRPHSNTFYNNVTMENTATSQYRPVYVRRKRDASGKPIGHRKSETFLTSANSWMRMTEKMHPLTREPFDRSNLRTYRIKRYKTAPSSPERGSYAWRNMRVELSKIERNAAKKSASTAPRSMRL